MQFSRKLILASTSPRRQYLMKEAGFAFQTARPDSDESFPSSMAPERVPSFLAERKAKSLFNQITDEIIIASDTVVILKGAILNKPADAAEACSMLTRLSGKTHTVITAVCLMDRNKIDVFDDRTEVTFCSLTADEIRYYVNTHKPLDKAGAYGAQDWLGMVGIERINGSYFTVMGLPMHKVYKHLQAFHP
jgi:septum formation protein